MKYSEFKEIFGIKIYTFEVKYKFEELKPSLQKSLLKLILDCPSENVSHLSVNFNSRGVRSKIDY